MALRTKVNLLVIALIGLGMPLYYKVKFLILGMISWIEVFDPIGLIDVCFGSLLATLVVLGHDMIVKSLKKIFEPTRNHLLRLTWQLIITGLFSMATSATFTLFFWSVVIGQPVTGEYIFDFVLMSLFIPLMVNGITESIFFYGEWERENTLKAQLEKENVVAKYEILKNQISPHFLFNCFNSLAILIGESKEKALQFLKKLSISYRYILESGEKELISLKEELEALDAYIHLMRVRFGDHFQVNFNFDEEQKREILLVPMSLQLLFENALKHNLADDAHQLSIRIGQEGDTVHITNNITSEVNQSMSTGIGLKNLLNRYKTITSQPVMVTHNPSTFSVSLPILRKL